MNNAIRLQYLAAMGINVWLPRVVSAVEHALPTAMTEPDILMPTNPIEDEQVHPTLANSNDWDILKSEVQNCTLCGLCNSRTQTVFGTGNQRADWLIIGEAPGEQEDKQGQPFVGVAGQLLTEMLRAIGLSREEVFITNILKCRPPNNRDPHVDEIKHCKDYLQRQQQLIKPKIILAVGRIAAQTLLETNDPLAKLRGKVHTLNNTPMVVVYHPAYLLRSLPEKRKAWQDLQLAKQTVIAMENKICVD
ncbi:MAG: uracil-DNA glycosylase [Methylococcaceae bacterium]|nr:uracil-DNA glycosylase [Methylococcaceae bacterium]